MLVVSYLVLACSPGRVHQEHEPGHAADEAVPDLHGHPGPQEREPRNRQALRVRGTLSSCVLLLCASRHACILTCCLLDCRCKCLCASGSRCPASCPTATW